MDQKYPEPTVGALIFNKHGKILLVRSHKWVNGRLTVPGGHIELGESAADAIIREVKEETGLEILPSKLLMVQEAIYSDDFFKKKHFIFFDFVCQALSEDVQLDQDELQEYAWYDVDEVEESVLEPYTRNLIATYRRNSTSGPDSIYPSLDNNR